MTLCTAACGLATAAHSASEIPDTTPPERQLRLANVNTGEILDVVYWKNGKYIADNVGQLNYFMRDHHVNESALMDKRLYDNLYQLHNVLGTDSRIHVLSGFRTSATNENMRKRSKDVAKRSFHIKGRAVDFYVPGVDNNIIQKEARRLKLGGVGYYTRKHFVHLDTGFPRHWVKS